MLVLLSLLYLLKTGTGFGAVASPTLYTTASLRELLESTNPCPSSNQRSTWDIVWSCFATIFACSWVSVHPNVPGRTENGLLIAIHRVKSMFWALIAPEFVITWAAIQYFGAKRVQKKYAGGHHDFHSFSLLFYMKVTSRSRLDTHTWSFFANGRLRDLRE